MDTPSPCHHEFPILGRAYFLGGRAATSVKRVLAEAGVEPDLTQRVCVACYEAEMNVVLHARSGYLAVDIFPDRVEVTVQDRGPGIADLEQAMTPGWSSASEEARSLGFGAGMGLPNIREQADEMRLESAPGEGARLHLVFHRKTGDRRQMKRPPTGEGSAHGDNRRRSGTTPGTDRAGR